MRFSSLLIISAVVLASCGGGTAEESESASDSTAVNKADIGTAVTAYQLTPSTFNHYFTVQGVVETDQNALIYPEAPARITSIKVKEGDNVKKGQVLMVLDSRIITNQIDEMKLRLSLAETIFKKQKSLWDQEIGSEIQYLEAKNNFESLQQSLEALQAQQDLYTITAPFSGIMDEIVPKEGEMANPAMAIGRLINTTNVYIKADVTERYLAVIKAGDEVEVTFPSMGISRMSKIERLGNFINPANRTFKVRIGLDNNDMSLKPNLLGELKIKDYSKDSAAVIPTSLVQMTPTGDEFVFAIVEGRAQKVAIETGLSFEDVIEVTAGLKGTEQLIDRGARSIKEGDKLTIKS